MKTLITLFVILLTAITCSAAEVNLNINYNVDGEPFYLNKEYTNSEGVKYKITRLEYYMCKFEFDGEPLTDTYVLANGSISKYHLGNFDIDQVKKLQLSVGVDKENNIGVDPNSFDAFHPLSPKNPSMHWGWSAGYRFWAIEALTDTDGDGEYDKSFQYHVLGDESFRTLSLDVNADIDNGIIDIMIDFDIQKFLTPIDMSSFEIIHDFYSNSLEVRALVDNIVPSNAISSQATTSVEGENNSLFVAPNPAENYLNIGKEYLNSKYEILSLDGIIVISGTLDNSQIEIEDIPTGTYFVRIFNTSGVINTAKFVKK